MASKVTMMRRGMTLVPTDTEGQEALRALKMDELVAVVISRPRNVQHHRKFFKMIGEVFQAQNYWLDQDDMLDSIKIRLGHCKEGRLADGTLYYIPKSISFAQMDQTKFEEFYNRFLDYCVTTIIPGVNKKDFEMHLLSIMDGRDYEGMMR